MRALLVATMMTTLAVATSACTYSPNFADGVIMCGVDDSCPKGYTCAADGTCSKRARTSNPDAGDPSAKFIGTWNFLSGTLDGACDGSTAVRNNVPANDHVDVAPGASGLLAKYYCDAGWTLRVGGDGKTATATNAAQVCPRMTLFQNIMTTYNWSPVSFSITTADGVAGDISAHLTGPYTDSAGGHGTCDLIIGGSLLKASN